MSNSIDTRHLYQVIALDLNKTLINMDYEFLIKQVDESLIDKFGKDAEATKEYEIIIEKGLDAGILNAEALEGVPEFLEEAQKYAHHGIIPFVLYTTCTALAGALALEKAGIYRFFEQDGKDRIVSTITDLENFEGTKDEKTAVRFARYLEPRGMAVAAFVDDKFDCVKQTSDGCNEAYDKKICTGYWLNAAGKPIPQEGTGGIEVISSLKEIPLKRIVGRYK